jgi:hypothetical protein
MFTLVVSPSPRLGGIRQHEDTALFIGFIPLLVTCIAAGLSLNPKTVRSARVMWLVSIVLIAAWDSFHAMHHMPVMKTYGSW